MNKTTIQEAQALKKVLVETIEEALNTFTTKTGLKVDYLDVRKVYVQNFGAEPEVDHYKITTTINM